MSYLKSLTELPRSRYASVNNVGTRWRIVWRGVTGVVVVVPNTVQNVAQVRYSRYTRMGQHIGSNHEFIRVYVWREMCKQMGVPETTPVEFIRMH